MDSNYVYSEIAQMSARACQKMNEFSSEILRTRGGRIGSGMGALLEALWGYMMNQIILEETDLDCEIAWFPDISITIFLALGVMRYGMPQRVLVSIFVSKLKV